MMTESMEMQREDFINLCKLPEMSFEGVTPRGIFSGRTRDGMGSYNVRRVLQDQFPSGAVVRLPGACFISRGPSEREPFPHVVNLILLSADTLEEKRLSVSEALTLAALSPQIIEAGARL